MKLFPCYIAIAIATPKIKKWLPKGTSPAEKNVFFRALPELPLPPPPNSDTFLQLFLDVKNDVLMRIAELSNDDCDNDGSDNCDYDFDTFVNFGVKNDLKVSQYDIDVTLSQKGSLF